MKIPCILTSLQPILADVQKTNKLFETKNVDKIKLLDDMTLIFKSILSKLVLSTCKADPLNCTIEDYLNPIRYLGYSFKSKISEFKSETCLSQMEEYNLRQQ